MSGLLPVVPIPPGSTAHRLGAGAPNTGASSLRAGRHPVLEGALHGGVDRVEALEGQRLGRRGAPIAVVGEHAVRESEAARLVERRGALVEHAQTELDVPEETALGGQPDLRPERELARLAD